MAAIAPGEMCIPSPRPERLAIPAVPSEVVVVVVVVESVVDIIADYELPQSVESGTDGEICCSLTNDVACVARSSLLARRLCCNYGQCSSGPRHLSNRSKSCVQCSRE